MMRQLKIIPGITKRDEESLNAYLVEIGEYSLVTPEEEVSLAEKIREGDDEAFEKLCNANLRFVVSVAKQYQNQGLSLPDLINEGNLGLIIAVRRFDEKRGFKLISYAVWWIRQSILQALAEKSRIIRLPLNQVGNLYKIKKIIAKFEQENDRPPTQEELALEMDISEDKIALVLKNISRALSLDAPLSQDGDDKLSDTLPLEESRSTDEALIEQSLKYDIKNVLKEALSTREREVIGMYFGLEGKHPMTLEEIGTVFGLTRERVRQIKEKAIRGLKYSGRGRRTRNILRKYLG